MLRLATRLLLVLSLPAIALPALAQVETVGEIVVIEGDGETITGPPGDYSIVQDSDAGIANIDTIIQRFYDLYPDEFDMISIWTTFDDQANGGAYFTTGFSTPIGVERMSGFINMDYVGKWSGLGGLSTMGQEFGHRWLVWEKFVDPATGMISEELLGRDGSHWSSLVDTEGSVMDGVDWADNGDGTFTVLGNDNKYGPIDLWKMGFVEPTEVPPFFFLRDARYQNGGESISKEGIWEGLVVGAVAVGTKVDLTIDDIIAAQGPQPPTEMRQHDFRVAFLLVTEPGQKASAVMDKIATLDEFRLAWNEIFVTWTWGRGTMCTDATAPCDIPHARFVRGRVREGSPSDGDGVVEPGEHAAVEVDWANTGTSPTVGAVASLETAGTSIAPPAEVAIDEIPVGGTRTSVFDLALPGGVACAEEHVFLARARMGTREWRGKVSVMPGILEGPVESFATDGGWQENPAAGDTAQTGGWDYGPAEPTAKDGYQLQPTGGRGGETDSAWWTGRHKGYKWEANDVDFGVTTLVSAPYDLSGMLEPVLRYHLWYQAWNFNVTPPQPATGDDFVVEASTDDGATWKEIDRVAGAASAWARREVALGDKLWGGGTTVRFRFTAQDSPPTQNLVEVGIDDVSVWSLSPSCDTGACSCRVGGGRQRGASAAAGWALAAVLGIVGARRRRLFRAPP